MNAEDRDIVMKRFQSNLPSTGVRAHISSLISNPPLTDLNPLAFRKGKGRFCQICFKTAFFTCLKCHQANYCSKEHREEDLTDFHPMVCEHMAYIGAKPPFSIFKDERDKYQQSVVVKIKELLAIAQGKAKESLLKNDPRHAVNRSTYIHRYAAMLFRKADPRHISPILINAEALAIQGDLTVARKMLNKAEVILTLNGGYDIHKTEFYRTKGVIDKLEGDYLDALSSFAEEVYWASEAFHTEHPRVARGYYNMGTMFLKFNRKKTAFSYFEHAVDIWLLRLQEVFQVALAIHEKANPLGAQQIEIDLTEDDSLLMLQSLNYILEILSQYTSEISKEQLLQVYYALAHVNYLRSKFNRARTLIDKACSIVMEGFTNLETDQGDATAGKDSVGMFERRDSFEVENRDSKSFSTYKVVDNNSYQTTSSYGINLNPIEAGRWMDKLKQFRKYCRRHSV